MVSDGTPEQSVGRVFVGIPTINRPELVKRAIASVLRKSGSNFELVVSDNGSEEPVPAELAAWIEELGDARVRFHRQPKNEGEYGQGRYFLAQATDCDYLVMLHDDDALDEAFLATAVEALEKEPSADVFVANPRIMDPACTYFEDETTRYLAEHGRNDVRDGVFDVTREFLRSGFTPISGTLFRVSILRKTGFVTPEFVGNYPFECDVFLRLADHGVRGVFNSQTLLSFCFHPSSMRNYMNPMNNRACVERLVALFGARSYRGAIERRRRTLLSRYYRALALLDLRERRIPQARAHGLEAVRNNPLTLKGWPTLLAILAVHGVFASLLGPLPELREAPKL